jgi:hypothetical protein
MFNFFKNKKPTIKDYKLDAQIAGVPENEIELRFACFEAMSLAFAGKQEEAEDKLKQVNMLNKKFKDVQS